MREVISNLPSKMSDILLSSLIPRNVCAFQQHENIDTLSIRLISIFLIILISLDKKFHARIE